MKKFLIIIAFILLVLSLIFYLKRHTIKSEFKNLKKPLQVGNIFDLRLLVSKDSQKCLYRSDSLKIIADLYNNKPHSPAIILLHGSSIKGRKLEVNEILGEQLFENGFTVLAIDLRGYGESEDPKYLKNAKDFDFAEDVHQGINFLIKNTKIDTSRIYIFGHSFGAGVAISAIYSDNRIKKGVIFGPPRRYNERFFGSDTTDRNYLVKRKERDMNLNYNLPLEIYSEVIKKQDIETYIPWFNEKSHIPIFLIDCAKEDKKDLEFLKNMYRQISQPVMYWTVPGVGHYLNTSKFFSYPVYNKSVIDGFVENVSKWLNK